MFIDEFIESAYIAAPKIPPRPRRSSSAIVEINEGKSVMASTDARSAWMGEIPRAVIAAVSINDL